MFFNEQDFPYIPFEGQWRWKFERHYNNAWQLLLQEKIGLFWAKRAEHFMIGDLGTIARKCIKTVEDNRREFPKEPIPGRYYDVR